jgi:flagellar hook-length control protein FliK
MDAGMVMPAPPPTASTLDAGPDTSAEDAAAFAGHLASENEPRVDARPRKGDKPTQAPANDTAPIEDELPADATPALYSMATPAAPVIVRADGTQAPVNFMLTPTPDAALAGINGKNAPVPPTPALPASTPAPATPATPVADAASQAATPATNAQAPVPTDAQIAAALATPKEAAGEPLRATTRGRSARGELEATTEGKPAAAAPQQTAAPQGARTQTEVAVTPALAVRTTGGDADSTQAQSQDTGEIAPATPETRRLMEGQQPSAVHRPPTLAHTVAQQIIRRFEGQNTSIEVRLDPAELGKVSVRLEVGPDARVTAVVAADNPATLSDLMRSARELERALESAGLELANGGLSFDLAGSGADYGEKNNGDGGSAGARGAAAAPTDATAQTAPATRPFGLESWRGARVDMTV